MPQADTLESVVPGAAGARPFPRAAVHELNARFLELLVHQARTEGIPKFELAITLKDSLRRTTPEIRNRVAARAFLLLDLEFQNSEWWEAVRRHPRKHFRSTSWHGSLPRRQALPLTRATLLLSREACQADPDSSCIILGSSRPIAGLIAGLQLAEIEEITERQFRHLRPRWHDRSDFWRSLLTASEQSSGLALRRTDLHALELIAGELMDRTAIVAS